MTPRGAVFGYLFTICKRIHSDTFEYLNNGEHHYPFIYIGESFNRQAENNDLFGIINQTIHLYGTHKDRSKIESLIGEIHDATLFNSHFGNYSLSRVSWSDQSIPENQSQQGILHYIITIELNYNKRGSI